MRLEAARSFREQIPHPDFARTFARRKQMAAPRHGPNIAIRFKRLGLIADLPVPHMQLVLHHDRDPISGGIEGAHRRPSARLKGSQLAARRSLQNTHRVIDHQGKQHIAGRAEARPRHAAHHAGVGPGLQIPNHQPTIRVNHREQPSVGRERSAVNRPVSSAQQKGVRPLIDAADAHRAGTIRFEEPFQTRIDDGVADIRHIGPGEGGGLEIQHRQVSDGFVAQFNGWTNRGGGGDRFEARRLASDDATEPAGLSLGEIRFPQLLASTVVRLARQLSLSRSPECAHCGCDGERDGDEHHSHTRRVDARQAPPNLLATPLEFRFDRFVDERRHGRFEVLNGFTLKQICGDGNEEAGPIALDQSLFQASRFAQPVEARGSGRRNGSRVRAPAHYIGPAHSRQIAAPLEHEPWRAWRPRNDGVGARAHDEQLRHARERDGFNAPKPAGQRIVPSRHCPRIGLPNCSAQRIRATRTRATSAVDRGPVDRIVLRECDLSTSAGTTNGNKNLQDEFHNNCSFHGRPIATVPRSVARVMGLVMRIVSL